jgi:hypothetical protein
MEKSIVGELVGKRGIVYAPVNRAGVLLIFSRLLDEFDMLIEEVAPDCSYLISRRRMDTGQPGTGYWERVKIALACSSTELKEITKSNEDAQGSADLLICWQHDWPDCPIEAFELRSLFAAKPATQGEPTSTEMSLNEMLPENSNLILKNRGVSQKRFEKAIGELDDKIKKMYPSGN